MGEVLHSALIDKFGQHPHIGDIRGRGLFRGLEIVQDRESKAPFDPNLKIAARLKKIALNHGLICYSMSGTIDGNWAIIFYWPRPLSSLRITSAS